MKCCKNISKRVVSPNLVALPLLFSTNPFVLRHMREVMFAHVLWFFGT